MTGIIIMKESYVRIQFKRKQEAVRDRVFKKMNLMEQKIPSDDKQFWEEFDKSFHYFQNNIKTKFLLHCERKMKQQDDRKTERNHNFKSQEAIVEESVSPQKNKPKSVKNFLKNKKDKSRFLQSTSAFSSQNNSNKCSKKPSRKPTNKKNPKNRANQKKPTNQMTSKQSK